jgi:hypothetical protein
MVLRDADANDFSQLTRSPSDMQKYLLWRLRMRSSYSDISEYVRQHRIGWALPTASGYVVENETPFAHPSDYRIRRNDWPYGLTPDIAHMVVWLKTPIEVDNVGDPTSASKRLIEAFVTREFRNRIAGDPTCAADRILWFKNRARWQSVRSLEHIHVVVRGVDQSLIEEWTGQTELDIVARFGSESRK